MTRRGVIAALTAGAALVLGLALGNRLYLFMGILLALTLGISLISVIVMRLTLHFYGELNENELPRGKEAVFSVRAKCFMIAGECTAHAALGGHPVDIELTGKWMDKSGSVSFPAGHVGAYRVLVPDAQVTDPLHLFQMKKKSQEAQTLLVLPRPFPIDKPTFCTGEEGGAALRRTQEDTTSPDDTRTFRRGDAMKRVHWKLSARKRELMVRTYETPAPPDTLILLDCNEPKDNALSIRDTLCETAVAVAQMQMADGSPVRLPLYGERANEFESDRAEGVIVLERMLAGQTFHRGEDFARVLQMELRRMRRTGATVIITTRLDALVADQVISIRRMGPSARVYLVTNTPGSAEILPVVRRLQHHLVEVCYVTPA